MCSFFVIVSGYGGGWQRPDSRAGPFAGILWQRDQGAAEILRSGAGRFGR